MPFASERSRTGQANSHGLGTLKQVRLWFYARNSSPQTLNHNVKQQCAEAHNASIERSSLCQQVHIALPGLAPNPRPGRGTSRILVGARPNFARRIVGPVGLGYGGDLLPAEANDSRIDRLEVRGLDDHSRRDRL